MTDTQLLDPAWLIPQIPADQDGGDGDRPEGYAVCIHITDPQGTTFSSSCEMPADVKAAHIAAAALQTLRAATLAHSSLLHTLLADLISRDGTRLDADRAGGLTVALVDQIVNQHMALHGHAPDRMEIPSGEPGLPPYQLPVPILRAVLAAAHAW